MLFVLFSCYLILLCTSQNFPTQIASSSWGYGRIDVFVKGFDSNLWHIYYDSGTWHFWENLKIPLISGPCVTSWGWGRLDLYISGSTNPNSVLHISHEHTKDPYGWISIWEDGNPNSTNTSIGIMSGFACASYGYGRNELLGVGTNGHLFHRFDNLNWVIRSPTMMLPNDQPAAVWILQKMYIFGRNINNNILYYKIYDKSTNTQLGFYASIDVLNSGPAAIAWDENRMDVFYRGNEYALWQKTILFNGTHWDWNSTAVSLGGTLTSSPSVASWGYGRIDVFVRGSDNKLWTRTYDICNGGWAGWSKIGDLELI